MGNKNRTSKGSEKTSDISLAIQDMFGSLDNDDGIGLSTEDIAEKLNRSIATAAKFVRTSVRNGSLKLGSPREGFSITGRPIRTPTYIPA